MNGSFPEIKIKRTFEQAWRANASSINFSKELIDKKKYLDFIIKDFFLKVKLYEHRIDI